MDCQRPPRHRSRTRLSEGFDATTGTSDYADIVGADVHRHRAQRRMPDNRSSASTLR
jgi:hypothetical protein